MKNIFSIITLFVLCAFVNAQNAVSQDLDIIQKGKKWGGVNEKGKTIIPFIYDEIYATRIFNHDNFFAIKGKKMGIINNKGEVMVPFEYDILGISLAHDDYFFAKKKHKAGLINIKGEVIIPFEYGGISLLRNNYYIVQAHNYLKGVIDIDGNVVVPIKYRDILKVEGVDELVLTNSSSMGNHLYGLYNIITKQEIVVPQYYQIKNFEKEFALVKESRKTYWGLIDKQGNVVVPFQFSDVKVSGSDRIFAVKDHNNLWGFVDDKGVLIIKHQYIDADSFYEGLAKVKKGNRWGYVDIKGNVAIPFDFTEAHSFNKGKAKVSIPNGKSFYIDTKGNAIN